MKILHLSKYYKPFNGGVESVVADLAEEQASTSHTVTVIAVHPGKTLCDSIINGVRVINCKLNATVASTPISLTYINKVIEEIDNCDVVHIHLPNPTANLALLLAHVVKKKRKCIIVHWHSDIIKQKKLMYFYNPFVRMLLKLASRIIVTSDNYLDNSEQLVGFKDKCVVVPIGIESLSSLIRTDVVEDIQNKYKGKRIVFSLGRHIYYKGFEYLVEAAKDVENTVFLIGGVGPDTDVYKRLVVKYKVDEKVFFLGKIESVLLPSFYKAADVFCFPSIEKSEAYGVVQLEAMSVGTPVVSTEIVGSGVSWVNQHNISGLICQPKDVCGLSNTLSLLLNSERTLERLSLGAEKRYLDYFTRRKMVEKCLEVYMVSLNR